MKTLELAKTLTERQISAIESLWDKHPTKLATFKSLLRLGDSRPVAMATVLNQKDADAFEYELAYLS